MQKTVEKNWDKAIAVGRHPYDNWDEKKLKTWLKDRNVPVKEAEVKKDQLSDIVRKYWYSAEERWDDASDWVFNTWGDTELKAFLDKHGIPNPSPRTRDTLLSRARKGYTDLSKKAGETAAAPGNWLFESWSDSDLKSWADYRGISVPQGSKRNDLIALVRRHLRDFSIHAQDYAEYAKQKSFKLANAAKVKAGEAADSASEWAFDTWSDSDLKKYADKNGISVPQGSKKNEIIAALRKHSHKLTADPIDKKISKTLMSAYGAATSNAGNLYAQATDAAAQKRDEAFAAAVASWSDSDIKAFLDRHGVPVPQSSKRDELVALARRNAFYYTQGPEFKGSGVVEQLKGYARIGFNKARQFVLSASGQAYQKATKQAEVAGDYAKEKALQGKHRAQEAKQKAGHKIKEEF